MMNSKRINRIKAIAVISLIFISFFIFSCGSTKKIDKKALKISGKIFNREINSNGNAFYFKLDYSVKFIVWTYMDSLIRVHEIYLNGKVKKTIISTKFNHDAFAISLDTINNELGDCIVLDGGELLIRYNASKYSFNIACLMDKYDELSSSYVMKKFTELINQSFLPIFDLSPSPTKTPK